MNYKETVAYLYDQLPMFSRIGSAAYKKDLHNTIALCLFLGNSYTKYKTIHVAGTNGKGSTSHMLAAILQAAGYKTGLYTSPHLKDFRERIRVNGEKISESFIVDFVGHTKAISDKLQPSFFELTVAMAFEYFADQRVDIAVIETGMGGLLDSTNVITPILSVITNIGYDHQQILGNNLAEIAVQKAGIIKENIPAVIGESLAETRSVFTETAEQKNAPLFFAEENFIAEYIEPAGNLLLCNIKNIQTGVTEKLRLGLPGSYQSKNACTVLAAIAQLKKTGLSISEVALHQGLEEVTEMTGLKGRWEILGNHPTVIADVAHNKDGIQQVVTHLFNTYPSAELHFVLGFVKDKNVSEILPLMPDDSAYYFTNAHIPRALPFAELKNIGNAAGLTGEGFDDVNEALAAAKAAAKKDDVIIICGSFYLIAELNEL